MKIIIKNLYYFINDITKIIVEKEGINDFSKLNRRQIFAHFLKSSQLIKIFFLVHLLLLNISSFFLGLKTLKSLSFSKKKNYINYLKSII